MSVKVSVCMIAYNHEKYIAQAIEGVLMQVTNFDYELVIGEDCSTDNTRAICLDYQRRYPDKIRLLLREKNLGMMQNFVQTLNACTGQYVAMLEGDDYWTSPRKLQTQADFLDAHPDFSICAHNVAVKNEPDRPMAAYWPGRAVKEILTIEDVLRDGSCGATASLVFRNRVFGDYPESFITMRGGDVALQILCASHGKMRFFPEVMGVYRTHDRGAYYALMLEAQAQGMNTRELLFKNMLYANETIDRYFGFRYTKRIRSLNAYVYWSATDHYAGQNRPLRALAFFLKALPVLVSSPAPAWLPAGGLRQSLFAVLISFRRALVPSIVTRGLRRLRRLIVGNRHSN